MPIVLTTTPPHPASKARRMLASDSVGGADASRNGFSNAIPVNVVESVGFMVPPAAGPMILPLPGVGQLDEELAVDRLQAAGRAWRRQIAVVAGADEQHRLPFQLVGEQHRTVEAARAIRHRERIERRI